MSAKRKAYVPSMADAAVKAKTGRDWAGWFELLDQAGAAGLEHKAITALLIGLRSQQCGMHQPIPPRRRSRGGGEAAAAKGHATTTVKADVAVKGRATAPRPTSQ